MALQSSGTISLSQIYAEVVQQAHNGSTQITLDNMGLTANQYGGGFNTTNPDSMSEFYGWAYYYPPTVAFTGVSGIGPNGMTLSGNVTSWGSGTPENYGFYLGTSATCTSNARYAWTGSQGVTTYSNAFTGLSPSTTYYFCAFVKTVGKSEVVTSTSNAATTSAAVCYGMSIAKSSSGQAACTGSFRTYKIDTYDFSTATKIWAGTSNCTGSLQSAGYFSNGVTWRYWNGSSFTTSGNCTL
jgi:hypothetical protein